VKKGIKPNLPLLQAALIQDGPWSGVDLEIDENWLRDVLSKKISSIDWNEAAADVERFLNKIDKDSLRLWDERFFTQKAENMFSNS
jgi:hypothetical protein